MISKMSFKEYLKINNLENDKINELNVNDKISLILYMVENDLNILNESDIFIFEDVNKWLNKVGLKIHKSKGVIDYLKDFTTGSGKLILAAIKGDSNKVKELLKSINKEDFMDFLLKLDTLTLHIVTGPIHFIDALTGWDIMANLKHISTNASNMLKIFYDGINKVKTSIEKVLGGQRKIRMLKIVNALEYNMPKPI